MGDTPKNQIQRKAQRLSLLCAMVFAVTSTASANYPGAAPSTSKISTEGNVANTGPRSKVLRTDTPGATPESLSVQGSSVVGSQSQSLPGNLPSASAYLPSGGRALVSAPQPVAPTTPMMMPPQASQDPNLLPMALQMAGAMLKGDMFGGKNSKPGKGYDRNTDLRSTIERADGLNAYVNNVTAGVQGVPPVTCTSCLTGTKTDPRFETCNSKNSYFEDMIAGNSLPGQQLLKDHAPASSTMTCIAERMRLSNTGRYQYCSQGSGRYGQKVSKPCASERMVRSVASAYELTSECLAGYIDPKAEADPEAKASIRRAMFQLINHESSWVQNAVSHTEAGGFGQLTQSAIQHINRDEFGKIQGRIKSSSNPACQQLAKMNYKPMQGNLGNSCERIALQNGNPQLNMFYTMAHMRLVREQIEGQIDRLGLAANVRTQVIDQVTVWGHNVGSGGTGEILRLALSRNGNLLKSGQVGQFLQAMQSDTSNWHAKKGGRNPTEPTRFLAATQNDLATIEKRVNGKCGVVK